MDNKQLPIKVGELAESRSFVSGYRGAWFRCKIKDIREKRKEIECALEYADFPDEKIEWLKLYQKTQAYHKLRGGKRHLMVRPSFPPVYRESQMPDVNSISEAVVIVNDVWKVGDLVDWWFDNVFWSGTISEILGEGKFWIDLPLPPVGEGSTYEALGKDLRPSLDWSPTDGWIVPITEGESCARLIKPLNQESRDELPQVRIILAAEGSQNMTGHAVEEVRKDDQEKDGASPENDASFSSHISGSSLPPLDRSQQHEKRPLSPTACKETTQTQKAIVGFDVLNAGIGKSSCSDSVSSSHVRDATAEVAETAAAKEGCHDAGSLKKLRAEGSIPLHSLTSDTIEASIMDLEELLCRVKWMKGLLQMKNPMSSTPRPSWKFQEYHSSSCKK